MLIIKETQKQFYQKEINALHAGRPLPRDSTILALSPYLDDGLLRVGGRINLCDLPVCEKTPILIPGQSHIARLLVRHQHEKIYHQGRHLTEGAIRSEGLWITGGKRLVSSIIHHCVTCRKMRGKPLNQKMADLPKDRLTVTTLHLCRGRCVWTLDYHHKTYKRGQRTFKTLGCIIHLSVQQSGPH